MSGHSKFANIKHKKEKNDAAKGKIFTIIGREIAVAVKEGGGPDPANNFKLATVIAKAKANNMPNDTIERGIKKAAGDANSVNYVSITYEGYGPNGVAMIVNASTDNKNRTAADVRHVFDKFGGNLGTSGCVSYMFERKGVIVVEKAECKLNEDDLMMLALDNGAENMESEDEVYEITSSPEDFSKLSQALEENGVSFLEADVKMIPNSYISLDADGVRRMELILEKLDELDDVIDVYHNWEE